MDSSPQMVQGSMDGMRSPVRMLARSFKASRERWKAKYQGSKSKMKRLSQQARDATRSRDEWKQQAKALQARAKDLEVELAKTKAELASQRGLGEKI